MSAYAASRTAPSTSFVRSGGRMNLSNSEVNYIILYCYDIRRIILDVEMYLTANHELSEAIDMLAERLVVAGRSIWNSPPSCPEAALNNIF